MSVANPRPGAAPTHPGAQGTSNVPARDRYPNRPPLPNTDPQRVTAHFVPKPLPKTPSLFDLGPNETYKPDPAQLKKLAARLKADGFAVQEVRDTDTYVTATGPKKLFKDVLHLPLERIAGRHVNGLRYDREQLPFTGPARPTGKKKWAAFEARGLSAVVFPPTVQFAMSPGAPPAGPTAPLTLPAGLRDALDLNRIHEAGHRGAGVRVVQLDSGRHNHPYFGNFDPQTLGDADPDRFWGHGTAMAALFKTIAPAAFLITRDATTRDDRLFLDTFRQVIRQDQPHIIFAPLVLQGLSDRPRESLTQAELGLVVVLEDVMALAEKAGILILFAAGNGPADEPLGRYASASHPRTVSAGGCRLALGGPQRSIWTKWFASELYETTVSDVAGPCGYGSHDPHLTLPIPPEPIASFFGEERTGTPGDLFVETWGGSSAATAFAAGVASLLRGAFPGDTLDQLRDKVRALIPPPPAQPPAPWPNWAYVGW